MPLIALAVIACSTSDTHVDCSPTLTCTLKDTGFKPPAKVDAGPTPCDSSQMRCRATAIAAGGAHSCAIARARELFCWGNNSDGQLGEPSSDEDAGSRTQFVPALELAQKVSAGAAHTCALTEDGSIFCFGRNDQGQVSGVASGIKVYSPRRLELERATEIAAGEAHTCAVVGQGVVCWGSAAFGQVGREVADAALTPDLVPGTAGAVEVAAGVRHSCARLKSGRVLCWGELIDGSSGDAVATAEVVEVIGLEDATAITAGAGHSCALRAGGEVVCWGANASGQLGDGTTRASAAPVAVVGLATTLHIAAGGGLRDGRLVGHTCAIDKSFFVQCWGRNVEGQLGIGRADDSARPVAVLGPTDQSDEPNLADMIGIAAGGFHSCSLDHDGPVFCWGDDTSGQLGANNRRTVSFGRATRATRFSRPQ